MLINVDLRQISHNSCNKIKALVGADCVSKICVILDDWDQY